MIQFGIFVTLSKNRIIVAIKILSEDTTLCTKHSFFW